MRRATSAVVGRIRTVRERVLARALDRLGGGEPRRGSGEEGTQAGSQSGSQPRWILTDAGDTRTSSPGSNHAQNSPKRTAGPLFKAYGSEGRHGYGAVTEHRYYSQVPSDYRRLGVLAT